MEKKTIKKSDKLKLNETEFPPLGTKVDKNISEVIADTEDEKIILEDLPQEALKDSNTLDYEDTYSTNDKPTTNNKYNADNTKYNYNFTKKIKPSRTLLIKGLTEDSDLNKINSLEGLDNLSKINNTTSVYLTFNSIENSLNALRYVKRNMPSLFIKFYYYKIFFVLNNLDENTEYNSIRNDLFNYILTNLNDKFLYCKIYTKNKSYLGCGNLTVDTFNTSKELLSSTSGFKNFVLPSCSGTFYKYKNNKTSDIIV